MNVIGHERNKKYFRNVISNASLAHAYLFSGPDMIGKKMFALEVFKTINGKNLEGNPDFKMIGPRISEDESKIHIEDVRKLKSFFSLKPYIGSHKLAIIDDAHSLTPGAANALLKILEEPPEFSVIVLVSSLPGMIPATIVSRCEKVSFNRVNDKDIADYLTERKIKKEDKEFLAVLAGGRIGVISRLIGDDKVSDARKAIDDLRKLLNSGIFEKMDYAKKIYEKEDYQPKVDYWLNWVSAHLKTSPKNQKILKNLLTLNQIISQPQYNHRLALENFLLNL